ncbi:MAG: 50S ribosomal protein L10 [bacterium]
MPNPQKFDTVAELKGLFDDSDSIFITDYQGLDVTHMTVLRKNLRESEVTFRVAKNTLLKLAARQAGVPDAVDEHFNGPTAVAFTSGDASVAARILHDSFKDQQLPRTKMFMVEGKVFGGEDIKRLAELPSRDILLSHLVATVEAPLSHLVATLEGFYRKLVGSIDALAEKRKSEG